MSLLKDINTILNPLKISIETGTFSETPPDEYIVLTPVVDRLTLYANDKAHSEISEARISLFTKNNYIKRKKEITKLLLNNDITVTGQQYVGFESDTKYFHYAIDVMKQYEMEV
ncbi:hypothetical protein [Senegalia sp. (in: firmicutes)]|uniref:hypothetical protein n=1 Tax=Senegalia sp. (in: firmicutes) TaxID=1924098 RepID=UPI003F98E89B